MVRSLSLFRPITLSLSPINHLLSLRIGSYSPLSQTPSLWRRRPREDEFNRDPETPPRVLVVQPRVRRNAHLKVKLSEALNLANSLEEQRDGFFLVDFWDKQMPPYVVVQNPLASSRKGRADTYFGPGTVENIKCHINSIESEGELDAVFVNAILTGIQQRNLERAWGKPVLDRVGLIIAIFNAHAYTREAKLQAELAALMYQKSRLVRVRGPDGRYTFGALGEAEVVSGRGRGSGGRGSMSGAGETELELQRRRIAERRSQLLTEIEEVRRTRALQRASRRKRGALDGQALATVAVVGYTNAGKSTLVGALSKSDLYSDDRLFATVDPRLRSVTLPSGRKVLLSDTVGFISDLPVQLVEAFHATLEEVVEADLLMHVLDSSAPNLDEQRSTVLQVLKQIGVSEEKIQNMIEVWNKIDVQGDTASNNCLYDTEELETQPFSETDDYCNNNNNDDNQIKKELSDYSDDWLSPSGGPDSEEDQIYTVMGWTTPTENHSEPVEGSENSNPGNENREPHVKTSAVMGVGLQALLELVDEKLESIDEPRKVVHRTEFDRKWRPPRTEEDGVAVEQ